MSGLASEVRHLVGDVRRFGLLSAATVADRYATLVEQALGTDPLAPIVPRAGADPSPLVAAAAGGAEAYLRLLEATTRLSSPAPAETSPLERVVLPPTEPGATSATSLWVHNPTADPLADLQLTATALTSPAGAVIRSDAVTAGPVPGCLDPGGRAEVALRVRVPADQAPGTYLGLVLLAPGPADPVAVTLTVGAPLP